jgi:hypothetical protein
MAISLFAAMLVPVLLFSLGLLFNFVSGVWALRVLTKSDVKAAFDAVRWARTAAQANVKSHGPVKPAE